MESTGGADGHGVSGSSPVLSKAMQLAVCADPWCSRTDICTAMSTARRLHQMDGSAVVLITSRSCDHHIRIYGCVLMLTTIHAMVEKEDSFDTQLCLPTVFRQHKLYKLIQQRDAFAFTSPYRGHTTTTHATYDFAQSTPNAAIDTSVQQTRFFSRPARCRVAHQARVQTADRLS